MHHQAGCNPPAPRPSPTAGAPPPKPPALLPEPSKYHRGFREQVEKWPVHPLDIIIDWLGKYPKARVADFGCGEARLAATVPNKVCRGRGGAVRWSRRGVVRVFFFLPRASRVSYHSSTGQFVVHLGSFRDDNGHHQPTYVPGVRTVYASEGNSRDSDHRSECAPYVKA